MPHICAAYFSTYFASKSSAYFKKFSTINQHPYVVEDVVVVGCVVVVVLVVVVAADRLSRSTACCWRCHVLVILSR